MQVRFDLLTFMYLPGAFLQPYVSSWLEWDAAFSDFEVKSQFFPGIIPKGGIQRANEEALIQQELGGVVRLLNGNIHDIDRGSDTFIPIQLAEMSPPAFQATFPGVAYQLGNVSS